MTRINFPILISHVVTVERLKFIKSTYFSLGKTEKLEISAFLIYYHLYLY